MKFRDSVLEITDDIHNYDFSFLYLGKNKFKVKSHLINFIAKRLVNDNPSVARLNDHPSHDCDHLV